MTKFFEKHRERIVIQKNGCWNWVGAKSSSGYGNVRINNIQYRAHRVSYIDKFGPIPDNLVIDHLCKNKACVNPDHLEAVSQKINVQRYFSDIPKENKCHRGHEITDDNSYFWKVSGKTFRGCKPCALLRSKERYQKVKEESRRVID